MVELKDLLTALCAADGVSGFEGRAAQAAADALRPYCDEVRVDAFETVYAVVRCPRAGAPTVLLDAHIDQVGFVVTEVLEGGFVRFAPVGGIDPRVLLGAEVTLLADTPLFGVISCIPPHLMKAGESDQSVPLSDMVIDTGFTQAGEHVRVGTPVVYRNALTSMGGDFVTSRSLDDRTGLAAIVDTVSRLDRDKLRINVAVIASCREEIGAIGAGLAAFRLQPEYGIAVDVGHGKTPDAADAINCFELGGGTMIGMGPNLHPGLTRLLLHTARAHGIPHHLEVMEGDSGTNAWTMQVAGQGVAMGLLSIPLRYMHTAAETVCLRDIRAVSDLLTAFLHAWSGEVDEP